MRRMLALAALASACGLPTVNDEGPVTTAPVLVNACDAKTPCAGDATCSHGSCYATKTTIDQVTLEVTPQTPAGPGVPAYVPLTFNDDFAGAAFVNGTFELSTAAQVQFLPRLPAGTPSPLGCTWKLAADDSFGATATLLPKKQAEGLPIATRTFGSTPRVVDANGTPAYWDLSVSVPAEVYTLYFAPTDDEKCPIPPVLIRDRELVAGSSVLPIALGVPSTFSGTILSPKTASLEGFAIEIVDGATGYVVSTVGTIGPPDADRRSTFGASFPGADPDEPAPPLQYYPGDATTQIVRVRPPPGVLAPVLLWDRAVVDIANTGVVALDVSDLSLAPVNVSARLERARDAAGVAGEVRVRSTSILGAPVGVPASFGFTAQSGDDGTFALPLFGGDYDVIGAGPTSETIAATRVHWSIAAAPSAQGGRVVDLVDAVSVGVHVRTPDDREVPSVPVTAAAVAATTPSDAFEAARADALPVGPAVELLADANGDATFSLSPGATDVIARLPAATGFPWTFGPAVSVTTSGALTLRPSYPVLLFGRITQSAGPAGRASIRAFATTADDRYVEIGEATTDLQGDYQLLLPSSIPASP